MDDMSWLHVRDLWDSTHSGPESHGHVRVRCHPGMDWLTAYKVVIDYEHRRVTTYMQDGTRVVFQGDKHDILPRTVCESRCQGQLVGCLASLTLEDEVRSNLDLPRVIYGNMDVFSDELPGLPP